MAIIRKTKWDSLDNTYLIENEENILVQDIFIKEPNNPNFLNRAKLITYSI